MMFNLNIHKRFSSACLKTRNNIADQFETRSKKVGSWQTVKQNLSLGY